MSEDQMPPAAKKLDESLQGRRERAAKESPKPKSAQPADKEPPQAKESPNGYSLDIPKELLQPNATETLLNAQLAEALFMIRETRAICGGAPSVYDRSTLIQQSESLVRASVKIADSIAKLRGGGSDQKRFHYVVERVEGGGGTPKPENE